MTPSTPRHSRPRLVGPGSPHGTGNDRPTFLAKERLAHREITASIYPCHDLIGILCHKLPSKVKTDFDLIAMINDQRQGRLKTMQSPYQEKIETFGTSNGKPI